MRIVTRVLPAALLAALAWLPSSASAQATDASSVETAILDVLLAQGLIDQTQYEQLLAMAREKVADSRGEIDLIEGRLERLRAAAVTVDGGAPGKLLFRSPDGKWSLGLKGRIQARVISQKDDAPNIDSNTDLDTESGVNFSTPRVRLGFEGQAGAENVKYKLEWDMSTTGTLNAGAAAGAANAFNLRHAFVDWGFENGLSLRFGQSKFPFGREENISSGNIALMDRSLASNRFAPAYEPMAMLFGTGNGGEYEYYAAVSNGDGRSINNNDGDSENGVRKGVRFVWNAVGTPLKADGPAFQTVDSGETKVSFGASWMKNDNAVDIATKGAITAAGGLASVTDSESLGLDVQAMSGPWSILAEWFDRKEDRLGLPGQRDDGQTLQVGYFLDPHVWEIVARVSRLDASATANAPTAGVLNNTDSKELTLGLNRYVDGHNAKWMFDVVRTTFSNHAVAAGEDLDNTQYRIQYQAIF
ncbi:MAG: porin [Planctomycetota bacterium]